MFNGTTAAVKITSPEDIHDFDLGFAVTEAFISEADDIAEYEQVAHKTGIEARVWLNEQASEKVAARRRVILRPVGCGLCGIDSLEQVARSLRLSQIHHYGSGLTKWRMYPSCNVIISDCMIARDQPMRLAFCCPSTELSWRAKMSGATMH
ncbi:formate dehydrogenase accessory sulfurtransferase FdhD [Ruegeria sp. SCPC11]